MPLIVKSTKKLKDTITAFKYFVQAAISENPNYEEEFHLGEEKEMQKYSDDYDKLMLLIDSLYAFLQQCELMRAQVVEKKFSDPSFVGGQLHKLIELSQKRDQCKKDYDKMKVALKDKRERYQDLHLEIIMLNLEARIV